MFLICVSWQYCVSVSRVTMARARKALSPECGAPRPLPGLCLCLTSADISTRIIPTKIRAVIPIYKQIHVPLFFLFFLNCTGVYLTYQVICEGVINYKSQYICLMANTLVILLASLATNTITRPQPLISLPARVYKCDMMWGLMPGLMAQL